MNTMTAIADPVATRGAGATTMMALVYGGPGQRAWQSMPKPIIHDAGKNGMDFVDFYGIIPVGHTTEHREIIREALWAEMKRRQAWINTQTAIGLGGMEVTADPTWDPERGGPPIRVTWEEFHMHMKDQKFVQFLGAQVRLQRATAIMAEGTSQGGGLTDWATRT